MASQLAEAMMRDERRAVLRCIAAGASEHSVASTPSAYLLKQTMASGSRRGQMAPNTRRRVEREHARVTKAKTKTKPCTSRASASSTAGASEQSTASAPSAYLLKQTMASGRRRGQMALNARSLVEREHARVAKAKTQAKPCTSSASASSSAGASEHSMASAPSAYLLQQTKASVRQRWQNALNARRTIRAWAESGYARVAQTRTVPCTSYAYESWQDAIETRRVLETRVQRGRPVAEAPSEDDAVRERVLLRSRADVILTEDNALLELVVPRARAEPQLVAPPSPRRRHSRRLRWRRPRAQSSSVTTSESSSEASSSEATSSGK